MNGRRQRLTIKIEAFSLTEMTGWEEQYYKPVIIECTEGDLLTLKDEYSTNRSRWGNIKAADIRDVAGGMISYADVDDVDDIISITNGWDESRFTFELLITVEVDSFNHTYRIKGFTDKTDLSHNSRIDPGMRLYLTSIEHAEISISARDRGHAHRYDQPTSIVTGEHIDHNHFIGCNTTTDVLSNINLRISEGNNSHDNGFSGDSDISLAPLSKDSMTTYSSAEVSPINWLANIMQNFMYNDRYLTAGDDILDPFTDDFADDDDINIHTSMYIKSKDVMFDHTSDPLCVAISNLIGAHSDGENYRWSSLEYEDLAVLCSGDVHDLEDQTSITMVKASSKIDELLGTSMHGSSVEINAVKLISDVMSDFMSRNKVQSIEFNANNYDIIDDLGLDPLVNLEEIYMDQHGRDVEVRGNVFSRYLAILMSTVETHIFPIISNSGRYPVAFYVRAVVNRKIQIRVKFDSDESFETTVPLFTHSLQSGLLVKDPDYGRGRNISDGIVSASSNIITHLMSAGYTEDLATASSGGIITEL